MPYYKVQRCEIANKQVIHVEVVWEGSDLADLEKKFPRTYFTNGNTLDQLRPIQNLNSKTITAYWKREDGSADWELLKQDPRRIILRDPEQERKKAR